MANALIDGLVDTFLLEVAGRDEEKLKKLCAKYPTLKTTPLKTGCNIDDKEVILCVKPNALDEVACLLKGEAKILYSILAGIDMGSLKSKINSKKYVRAMPNIAAIYKKSTTSLYGDEDTKERAVEIFESIGRVFWLNKEEEIDIATALAGSSPAFFALIAEAMADGAVKEGLSREMALRLIQGAIEGSSELLKHKEPSAIKNEVMSPSGTTARGVASLEEYRIRYAFIKAIEETLKRARELNEQREG